MGLELSTTSNTSAVEASETDRTAEFPKVVIGALQGAVRSPQRLSKSCNELLLTHTAEENISGHISTELDSEQQFGNTNTVPQIQVGNESHDNILIFSYVSSLTLEILREVCRI